MNCHACQEWLQENWVDLPRHEEIRDHLAHCPSCRGRCREIVRIANILEGMAGLEPPHGLRQRVLLRVSGQHCQAAWCGNTKPSSGWRGRSGVLVAACLFVGALGPVLPNLFHGKNPVSPVGPPVGEMQVASSINLPESILRKPWPEWKDALQEEGLKALETAYRCVRPPAEAGWVTMTRALREAPAPFFLASGD